MRRQRSGSGSPSRPPTYPWPIYWSNTISHTARYSHSVCSSHSVCFRRRSYKLILPTLRKSHLSFPPSSLCFSSSFCFSLAQSVSCVSLSFAFVFCVSLSLSLLRHTFLPPSFPRLSLSVSLSLEPNREPNSVTHNSPLVISSWCGREEWGGAGAVGGVGEVS